MPRLLTIHRHSAICRRVCSSDYRTGTGGLEFVGRGRHVAGSTAGCASSGQTLVEFALVVVVFMVVTLGLLDGCRVVFYFSQVQEAAREGARWGAVQVGRSTPPSSSLQTPWGTFDTPGNAPGTYCDPTPCSSGSAPFHSLAGSRQYNGANTIVGAVTLATTAVDLHAATITISTDITATPDITETMQTFDDHIANKPVTVSIRYPFKPILGFVFSAVDKNAGITLTGTSSMLHE